MTKIAICIPSNPDASETFIRDHISLINPCWIYYGGTIPLFCNDKPLIHWLFRGFLKLIGHLKKDTLWHDRFAFSRSLRNNKPDVVLVEYGTLGADIIPISHAQSIPMIVHFHGYDASMTHILKLYSDRYKFMFEHCEMVIAVSNEMKKDLINMGCAENKILINPCAPNRDFFKIEPKYSSLNIISIGRFVDKKAPYYLILAMKRVVKHVNNARLTIVGDGHLKNTCQNLIDYYQLNSNITLIGQQSREKIIELMGQSSIYIQHSIEAMSGDKEGSPVAIAEAGAAGLPVVSTKHAGIVEAVIDRKTGYLVDEHDVESFTDRMIDLLTDMPKRMEFGDNAKQHISEFFSSNLDGSSIRKILSTRHEA